MPHLAPEAAPVGDAAWPARRAHGGGNESPPARAGLLCCFPAPGASSVRRASVHERDEPARRTSEAASDAGRPAEPADWWDALELRRREPAEAWASFRAMEVVGMPNVGNTCFMNVALQCLLATSPLTTHFLSGAWRDELNRSNPLGTGGELADAYTRLIATLWPGALGIRASSPAGSEAAAAAPAVLRRRTTRDAVLWFKRRLERHHAQFRGARQHDAQELASTLLDALHEDLNRCTEKPYIEDVECLDGEREEEIAAEAWGNYLQRNRSIIVDLFQGQLRSTVTCDSCRRSSTRFDPCMWLSVPLPAREPEPGCAGCLPGSGRREEGEGLELAECMQAFCAEETLSEDNHWCCPHCKQMRGASKRLSLYKLPPVLMIHLKRYNTRAHGRHASKRNDPVRFPLERADFSGLVGGPAARTPSVATAVGTPTTYSLYAVVRHSGSLYHGHYTATVARNGFWYECNDERVRPVSREHVASAEAARTAYLLFYMRDTAALAGAAAPPAGDAPASSREPPRPAPPVDAVMRVPRQSLSAPQHWPFPLELVPSRFLESSGGKKSGRGSSMGRGRASSAGSEREGRRRAGADDLRRSTGGGGASSVVASDVTHPTSVELQAMGGGAARGLRGGGTGTSSPATHSAKAMRGGGGGSAGGGARRT